MSEALNLLAAVAEQADTFNHDDGASGSNLRNTAEQSCAANGVASTYAQEAELANMVCGVVENYVKRSVTTVLTPSGQQHGVMVNLELLLQLATLVVGIVRRDATAAAAAEAASPGQSAASLTNELQLMDILVKTLNSQDEYPQQSQQPHQSSKTPANSTAFQLLMQHGSSSCLSSDSNLPAVGAEAAAVAGVPGQRGRLDWPTSPKQLSSKTPAAAAANGASAVCGAAGSSPLLVSGDNPTAGDVVSMLRQMYYSSDPSAAATAMALAAKLAASSCTTATATAPILRSLPLAQGTAAAAALPADIRAQEALAALATLQQQQQYHGGISAADVVQRQSSSSLERLSLDSNNGCGPAAAAAASQVDPSVWASALSAAAAASSPSYGIFNPMLSHPGFPCTPLPPPAAADAEHATTTTAAATPIAIGSSRADKYRERRAARASGVNCVKSAGASPTSAITTAAAAAKQMRRSASYQAALNDIRLAQHAGAQQSNRDATPMLE